MVSFFGLLKSSEAFCRSTPDNEERKFQTKYKENFLGTLTKYQALKYLDQSGLVRNCKDLTCFF